DGAVITPDFAIPPGPNPDLSIPCPNGTPCGDRCVDLLSDPRNCGACGITCNAQGVCNQGKCALPCAMGLTACSGACVNLQTDNNNCGKCTIVCANGMACAGGACACAN